MCLKNVTGQVSLFSTILIQHIPDTKCQFMKDLVPAKGSKPKEACPRKRLQQNPITVARSRREARRGVSRECDRVKV